MQHNRFTWKIFVVVGDSFIRSGGGGESTSSSGDTEHDRATGERDRDRDELLDLDFVHEPLQLDATSECGVILPFAS